MFTFNQQFELVDTQNNDYKSKKQTYKYFNTFNEPFTCSDVYRFTKQYINHLTSIFSNTCKTISVFK